MFELWTRSRSRGKKYNASTKFTELILRTRRKKPFRSSSDTCRAPGRLRISIARNGSACSSLHSVTPAQQRFRTILFRGFFTANVYVGFLEENKYKYNILVHTTCNADDRSRRRFTGEIRHGSQTPHIRIVA